MIKYFILLLTTYINLDFFNYHNYNNINFVIWKGYNRANIDYLNFRVFDQYFYWFWSHVII